MLSSSTAPGTMSTRQSVLQIIPRKPLGRIGHKQRGVRLAGEDLLRAFLRRADHGKLHVRPYA